MDKATFIEKVQKIGTCENQDDRLTLLTELSNEVEKDYDKIETLTKSLSETQENLKKAQETNMDFFTRLNDQKTADDVLKNSTGVEKPVEKEYKSYDQLIEDFEKRK